MNFRLSHYLLCCLLLMVFSCKNPFNPVTAGTRQANPFLKLDHPDNVLKNLESAYQQQNLNEYKNCLADKFVFQLLGSEAEEFDTPDLDNDGIKDAWWGYKQEVDYHENLFGDGSSDGDYLAPDFISLNLTIPPETQWATSSDDDSQGAKVIRCTFNLKLYFFNFPDRNIIANGLAIFHVQEINGQWKIIIWQDASIT